MRTPILGGNIKVGTHCWAPIENLRMPSSARSAPCSSAIEALENKKSDENLAQQIECALLSLMRNDSHVLQKVCSNCGSKIQWPLELGSTEPGEIIPFVGRGQHHLWLEKSCVRSEASTWSTSFARGTLSLFTSWNYITYILREQSCIHAFLLHTHVMHQAHVGFTGLLTFSPAETPKRQRLHRWIRGSRWISCLEMLPVIQSDLSYLSGKSWARKPQHLFIFASNTWDTIIYIIQGYHKWMVDQRHRRHRRRDCIGFKPLSNGVQARKLRWRFVAQKLHVTFCTLEGEGIEGCGGCGGCGGCETVFAPFLSWTEWNHICNFFNAVFYVTPMEARRF